MNLERWTSRAEIDQAAHKIAKEWEPETTAFDLGVRCFREIIPLVYPKTVRLGAAGGSYSVYVGISTVVEVDLDHEDGEKYVVFVGSELDEKDYDLWLHSDGSLVE